MEDSDLFEVIGDALPAWRASRSDALFLSQSIATRRFGLKILPAPYWRGRQTTLPLSQIQRAIVLRCRSWVITAKGRRPKPTPFATCQDRNLHLLRGAGVGLSAASLRTIGCRLGFCHIASECRSCESKCQGHGKNGNEGFHGVFSLTRNLNLPSWQAQAKYHITTTRHASL
jgi:hypothetical protein